ncbi:bifunctional DNA-binding transcriptional regulator/O6-methylguanine-DNA methyltransferase Ada [Raoultella ornithinolytica]|jgi:AraC family transcriptional regulator of adaptative response/methylated-DNA-[protein]-cysteine methyltransferase|uniref:Regulatory protein of adaptive response n=1 Tax=Raoultella ornithinolytica TaxID=54291 RepID=A0A855EXD6_RAOOR|nr:MULTISPECIES: bifunctional DNA-binding transcriptional regulator/O6-methylguanine-DNA methyltransferase Ada [Raoultella]ANZ07032.1 6-O-methylguanine DNA methyltransferase [Raoultella ornithinolytica]ASI59821.1 bifunctional transcriptional regulator/O6-methylguanine-DNA methyltransferase [Raoultella ornithinolytica]AYW55765.1 bifunctional DNA-binding transcriptional regulator/O6-methylguanine-DNA methyltransferase Ada [Raoultella ornithinolytica]EJD6309279.1 bifunctional DNA-binding transcrip
MKPIIADTDDRRWQAVCDRDVRADGQFVFAVLTTGICCRPSCRSRRALRENVRFYPAVEAAIAAGFRPCKRCQPDKRDPQQQKVDKVTRACRLLEQESPVTLEALAQELAVSPFHFHRLFKSVTGMTPKAWQQAWRARRLREALGQGEKVTPAVLAAGFPGGSSYYRQADAALGMTARQFRRGGEDTDIIYTVGDCAVGRCLVAESERGVCAVLPGEEDAALLDALSRLFPHARLLPGDAHFCQRVAEVFAHLDDPRKAVNLPLDLRGTAFQLRVWQALRQIPAGETRSYRQVAQSIGQPRAVRAVAGACAANKLAIVIPCHRVVREGGALSGYRWGTARKAQLLAREAQTEEK